MSFAPPTVEERFEVTIGVLRTAGHEFARRQTSTIRPPTKQESGVHFDYRGGVVQLSRLVPAVASGVLYGYRVARFSLVRNNQSLDRAQSWSMMRTWSCPFRKGAMGQHSFTSSTQTASRRPRGPACSLASGIRPYGGIWRGSSPCPSERSFRAAASTNGGGHSVMSHRWYPYRS